LRGSSQTPARGNAPDSPKRRSRKNPRKPRKASNADRHNS
jgi:hypothetical protein